MPELTMAVSGGVYNVLTIATILDDFSYECFKPEANLIPLQRTNYVYRIAKAPSKVNLLLVESAWRGNGNTWKNALVKRGKTFEAEKDIALLTKECKLRGIPTLFWNKEDPIHFDNFLSIARYFKYVATTDSNCVPAYKRLLWHDRVFVLPFAAQIDMHSPVGLAGRLPLTCFAGMYWQNQHKERKMDADLLLDVAMKAGLHIYDRSQAGGAGDPFPEKYSGCVQGGLPYTEVVKMYKQYRAFLNVNIVKTSPTMFSRRVFELLACGTPVVSSYSIGIAQMFPEVLIPGNANEAETMINQLLHDDVYWNTVSKAGVCRVLSQHTYAHRLATICSFLGFPVDDKTNLRVSLAQEIAEKE